MHFLKALLMILFIDNIGEVFVCLNFYLFIFIAPSGTQSFFLTLNLGITIVFSGEGAYGMLDMPY